MISNKNVETQELSIACHWHRMMLEQITKEKAACASGVLYPDNSFIDEPRLLQ